MEKKRIQAMDALRGLCVILMVCYHLLYDLWAFLDFPKWVAFNPAFDILQPFFAGVFIFLSGVSSRFSRSNLKRGLKVLAVACVVTAVTVFIDMPILFGVLHLLGASMVIYGLLGKYIQKIPDAIMPVITVLLWIGSILLVENFDPGSRWLWMFGWRYPGFVSTDYFPLFPWFFVFLLGTWFGKYVLERRLPAKFYELEIPVLPAIGRKSLLVYIVHQPVIYGIVMALKFILK